MSEHSSAPESETQEPEGINMGQSMAILVGSLLAFAAVVVWATLLMNHDVNKIMPNGWPEAPPEVGRAEVGMVNQKIFELDRRVERRTAIAREELHSYGWVDAKNGVVHVPIERAMEQLLQEEQTK
jgi:hypothetical protein